jgi:hypothetical protein
MDRKNPYAAKMTRDEFAAAYFNDPTAEKPSAAIVRAFWDDFKWAFNGSLKRYIQETTSDIVTGITL